MERPNIDNTGSGLTEVNHQGQLNYFILASHMLPCHYTSLDPSRLSAIYFVLVAIDLLGGLCYISKEKFIDYIYMLQLPATSNSVDHGYFGFIGGTFAAHNIDLPNVLPITDYDQSHIWRQQQGHIAMTYTALCSLITLEDDLSKIDRAHIAQGLSKLQLDNGSYKSYVYDGEGTDIRFVYCAMAIAHILNLWHVVDKDKTTVFILSCLTYEGGFGLQPGCEAQGGATYCAVASLCLMNRTECLDDLQSENLISWCQRRAQNGFEGRTNKNPDSCYAFWLGATVKMLNRFDELDHQPIDSFVLNCCKSKSGGFSKFPDTYPDILHSFYSISWLSMRSQLEDLDPMLAIRKSKADRWRVIRDVSFGK